MSIESKVQNIFSRAPDSDLVDRKAAAIALDISTRTLDRWHHDGFGPPRIQYRRKVRYRLSAIESWVRGHEHSPASQC